MLADVYPQIRENRRTGLADVFGDRIFNLDSSLFFIQLKKCCIDLIPISDGHALSERRIKLFHLPQAVAAHTTHAIALNRVFCIAVGSVSADQRYADMETSVVLSACLIAILY